MADPIKLVQGDTAPQIKVIMTRSDTGSAEDITDATVKLHFRKQYNDEVLFSVTGQSTPDEATAGTVIFAFANGQLDLDEGQYEGEVEVVFDTGTRETIYEVIDFTLRRDFA
jgi:hypothetical protein